MSGDITGFNLGRTVDKLRLWYTGALVGLGARRKLNFSTDFVIAEDTVNDRYDISLSGGGGGGGAPVNSTYVTLSADATLTNERILTAGTNISVTDSGAGLPVTLDVPNASTTVKGAAELATDGEASAGVVVQGNDSRLSNARTPTGSAGGDLTGTYPNPTVDVNKITFAKIQDIATDRLVGRDTAATGDPEEITVGGGIEFTGTGGIQTSALTGDVTKSAGGTATTISNDAVSYAKMQNVSAASKLLGRGDSGAGDPQEITLGSGLSMTGTTLSSSGGSGAPVGASYVTLATDVTLTSERVITAGTNISFTDGGAGSTLTLNVPDGSTTTKGAVELATDGENAANVVVQGNDSRLSDSRNPTAHKNSHKSGGGDAFVKDDVLVAETQYLNPQTSDPLSDSRRFWVGGASGEGPLKYWDNQVTPVKHTIIDDQTSAGGDLTGTYPNPTVSTNKITFAKMQDISTDRLVGRDTAASGDPEELTVGGGIEFTGSGGIQSSAYTGDVTKSAGGTATTIANDAVTYAKMQNVSLASKLIGRGDSGGGDPEEITLGSGLTMTGTTLSASAGGAPADATYLTLSTNVTLTNERVLTAGTNIGFTDGGAGSTLTVDVPNASTTVKGAAELATDGENAANVVVQGNDSRLSNARTPTAHKDTHKSGGSDPFVKGDVLVAETQYVNPQTSDPLSDSRRTWLSGASGEGPLKFWDNQVTPVKHTVVDDQTSAGGDLTGTYPSPTVNTNKITFAKMQDISTDRLLGRDTAATGDPEELTVSGGIEFTGSGGIQTSAFTGDVTKSAGGTATTIANDAVTYAKMQNVSAGSLLLGRGDSGAGDPQEITVGSGLSMTGTTLSATGGGGGDNITVNGVAATDADFDDATPAAVGSGINVKWQKDAGTPNNISAYIQEASASQGGIVTNGAQTFAGDKTFQDDFILTNTINLNSTISPAQLTVDQNDWAPTGLSSASTIRFSTDNDNRTVTGIDSTGVINGRIITLINIGSFDLFIGHEDTNSSAANRFLIAGNTYNVIQPNQSTRIQYDSTSSRWRVLDLQPVADTNFPQGLISGVSQTISGDKTFNGLTGLSGGATVSNQLSIQSLLETSYITPSQITADQNDYNPTGLSTANTLMLSSDASRNITGIAGGNNARILILHNTGSFNIVLKDESVSSSATNRFALQSDFTLLPNASCVIHYQEPNSRWAMLSEPFVPNDSITYAKMQNISVTDRLLGRDTAGAGDTEELTVGGGIEFTGSGGIQTSAFTGDVTKSAGGTATTIANDAVTYAKMQNISATDRLLGRDTAAAGDTEELTVGGGIEFTGTGGIQTSAFTGDVTKSAGGTATTIANDAVTYAKMQNISVTDRLLGRDTAGAGDTEELTVGGGIEFTGSGGIQSSAYTGDVTKSAGGTALTIANDAVTYAKMQNVSATSRFLGRITSGAGDTEELTGTQATSLLDVAGASTTGVVNSSSQTFGGDKTFNAGVIAGGFIQYTGDISPAQITSDQNDYNPTNLSTSSTLRLTSDASRNITGLAGGSDGRIIIIHNVGSNNIVLVSESASSTAANRFALNGNQTLATNHACAIQYDSTSSRWRLYASSVDNTSAGGGDAVSVNGVACTDVDLDDTTPAAVGSGVNVKWQKDGLTPNNVSGYIQEASTSQGGIITTGTQSFSGIKTIEQANERVFKLYRPSNTAANKCGIEYQLQNSTPAQTDYARTLGKIITNTAGAEYGQFNIETKINGTSTTVIEVNERLDLSCGLAYSGVISPSQITSNQNDYNPTGWNLGIVMRLSSDASRNITGIAGGASGRVAILRNIGTNDIVLKNEDVNSTAANRFKLGFDITLRAEKEITLVYDSTSSRWRYNSGTVNIRENLVAQWDVSSTKTNIGTSYVDIYTQTNAQSKSVDIDFTGYTHYRVILYWNKVGAGTQQVKFCDTASPTVNILHNFSSATSGDNDSGLTALPSFAASGGRFDIKIMALSSTSTDDPVFESARIYLI